MHYWRTLLRNLAAWLAAEMAYREDFLAALLTTAVTTTGRVFALWAMLTAGVDFGGWGLNEALMVMGAAVLLMGFFSSVVTPNLSAFSLRVFRGTFDYLLLKPLDVQFLVMSERFSLWGLPDLAAGTLLMAFAAARLGLSAAALAGMLLGLLAACLLFYLLSFSAALVAVRSMHVQNMLHSLAAFLQAAQYPTTAYGRGLRIVFSFVFPVYWMTQVPAEVALGRANGALLWGLFSWLLVALLISRLALWLALRLYGSASS